LFAELSIGLVGFAGVVSTLSRSNLTSETLAFRIKALLINAVVALAFSILPLGLGGFYNEGEFWLFALTLLICTQVSVMVWSFRQVQPLTYQEVPNHIRMGVFGLMLLAILFQCYGLVFITDYLSAVYLVGVAASFSVGVFHFCVLVVSIRTRQADAEVNDHELS